MRSRATSRTLAFAGALGAGALVVTSLSALVGGALGLAAGLGVSALLVAVLAVPCAAAVLLTVALPARISTRMARLFIGGTVVPALGLVSLFVAAALAAPPGGSRPPPGPPIDPVPGTIAFIVFAAVVGVIGGWPSDAPRASQESR